MKINELIGNNTTKIQLQSMFAKNKFPHAILLEGATGLGKKTLAKIIAQASICSALKDGLVGETCEDCKKNKKNVHPDIIYPEKSGALQGYSISTVRQIRTDAHIMSNEASRKVYIFTDVDNIGIPAQNAILKVLEEPPKNVIFIFTCVNPSNLLPTVRSRLQQFSLKPVADDELEHYLRKKCTGKQLEKLSDIKKIAKGNIGLALDLIDSSDLENTWSVTQDIAKSLASPREFDLLESLSKLSDDRKNFVRMLNFLEEVFSTALLLSRDVNLHNNDLSAILAQRLSTKQILNLIECVAQAKIYIDKNVSTSILISNFCSSLYKIAFNV